MGRTPSSHALDAATGEAMSQREQSDKVDQQEPLPLSGRLLLMRAQWINLFPTQRDVLVLCVAQAELLERELAERDAELFRYREEEADRDRRAESIAPSSTAATVAVPKERIAAWMSVLALGNNVDRPALYDEMKRWLSVAPSATSSNTAAQLAFDQQSDDPAPGDWNAACRHIADLLREQFDIHREGNP